MKTTGLNPKQFREDIIRPVLKSLESIGIPNTRNAEDLLVMIAAHESHLGHYVRQVKGPALGVYQIEPDTAKDVIKNYLGFRPKRHFKVRSFRANNLSLEENLKANLFYQTAMARIILWRVPAALPMRSMFKFRSEYLRALAVYAKNHWNTHLGAAEFGDYFNAYLGVH